MISYAAVGVIMMMQSVSAMPMPFPLPVNFSFGICGNIDPSVVPGCGMTMNLTPNIPVRCSTAAGCSTACTTSPLFQQVLSRFSARLGSQEDPTTSTTTTTRNTSDPLENDEHVGLKRKTGVNDTTSASPTYWWRLNNINCNLHDLAGFDCSGKTIQQCQTKCETFPSCGGFLYYSKTGAMAGKNSTCWNDIGPLPSSDDGDDLYVMHNIPQPPPVPQTPGVLTAVEVCVATPSEMLGADTDESYTVTVPGAPTAIATVNATSIFGAMHGLETLSQLVDVQAASLTTIPAAPVLIEDAPRYSFRGIMIDSGRHFLPVAHVKHIVEAAAMVKLNVIHWHLVDAQSFPTCSDNFPTLCEEGGYPNNYSAEASGRVVPSKSVAKAVYTPTQLSDVVAFAKARGVRIQPEWDMPGHGSWGLGKPELMTSACTDALDVTRPELYAFLKTFLIEMSSIFPEKYLFLGGDELPTSCFDESPTIAQWMKDHGLNSSSTQQYFWQQMTSLVFPHLNKTISVWRADDRDRGPHIDNLPVGSVMNVYQSLATAWSQTVSADVNTVVSMAGEQWYLDSECGGYNQNAWECIYSFKGVQGSWLEDHAWTPEQKASRFLGGETALWGEGINEDNFDAFAWRGAAAAAERLWATEESLGCPASTCPGITNARAGKSYWMTGGDPRLQDQLCRMSRMGVKTGPIAPGFCPSDVGAGNTTRDSAEVEVRYRLEQENAALKIELSKLRHQG